MNTLDYYSNIRFDILPFIEKRPEQRILEVGCGRGNTLAYLKEKGFASYVVGIEKVRECYEASNPIVDEIILADVETFDFSFKECFDIILFLDVLEHLYLPFTVLRQSQRLLTPSGYLVLSIPNIRNYAILKRLIIKGRWDYKDSGILDRTHIRFFTKKSFLSSLEKEVGKIQVLDYRPNWENYGGVKKFIPFLKEFLICQHLFKLKFK
jgi:2-polyprenyl-3-methyl-5-hydroxy-6-metoxy-1,4-benzoquinol methylase